MSVKVQKSVTVIDRGFNKLLANMVKLDHGYVKVGVQQGAKHKPSSKGSQPKHTSDLVAVAAANEFGAPKRKIPERSFIRRTADERRKAIALQKTELAKAVIDGRITPHKALSLLGARHKADVQDTIVRMKTPPNSAATQLRKGRGKRLVDNPLIDTGQLRQSIRYVVEGT